MPDRGEQGYGRRAMTTLSDAPYTSSTESDLERRKRLRTVVAASLLGTTVEWYDFFLYATAASLVFNQLFFPDQSSFVGTMLAFATEDGTASVATL